MRLPKPGCTCKIHGEGNERFRVVKMTDCSVVLETGDTEAIEKCHSIRYAPRLASYHRDKLNSGKSA
jgi:flagellar biosynthesis/type III secretory pathway ATPase